MAGHVLLVIPPTTFDASQFDTLTPIILPLARRIDVSEAEEVMLAVRVHSTTLTNDDYVGVVLAPDGFTIEDTFTTPHLIVNRHLGSSAP